ncbi:MAG: class I poly(R)-hydroxyalkanoic acid synthase [Alphaproteobacteria bacterium]|nr:class I poly(R)-hydroxyalkanoic acid synthase [Alphaproteobacteria bacterium]
MNDAPEADPKPSDPSELARRFGEIAEKSQKIVKEFLARQGDGGPMGSTDSVGVGRAFLQMTADLMSEPQKLLDAQTQLWHDYLQLWHRTTRRFLGETTTPMAAPAKGDYRFRDVAWEENVVFDYIKQSYLMTARWLQARVQDADGLDEHTHRKVEFYTRQFVDAMAPSNFVATNPLVLRETLESGGENLLRGLTHLLEDLEEGGGELRIRQTDMKAFSIGSNIAVTPGKVVYQTDLMQLIQYEPTTEKVYRRPLLIIPPWINKYYILDLRPTNSFVKWATDQGHTVFMISWVNPDESHADKNFEHYMKEGPLAALDAMRKCTGSRQANVIGYCLGGTLLAITLAYMAAKDDHRFASASYLASFVDFTDTGEMSVFIDEAQLAQLDERMVDRGYFEGRDMASTFNMLRANDLIWSFVINNYLLGKDPFPFDLLYWNADSTRMPAAMHSFYLRHMYHENQLSKPGGITIAGVPLDVAKITQPSFIVGTREDHIVPWKTVYRGTQLYDAPTRFILAASGHIAGVVNPPAANKYTHWRNPETPIDPEAWLAAAEQIPGSWWPEWARWIQPFGGGKVAARTPGDGKLPVIEDAPGSYVMRNV